MTSKNRVSRAVLVVWLSGLLACKAGPEGPPGPEGPEGPAGPPGPAGVLADGVACEDGQYLYAIDVDGTAWCRAEAASGAGVASLNTLVGNVSLTSTDGSVTVASDSAEGLLDLTVSETDPLFSASPASTIGTDDITAWDDAAGWGDHAEAGYARYRRTVVVGPVGDPTQNGAALLAALDAIEADESSPHLLKIEPGRYDLGASRFQMKSWVDVEGSGVGVTTLVGTGHTAANTGVVIGADGSDLRELTVRAEGGGSAHAIAFYAAGADVRLRAVALQAIDAATVRGALVSDGRVSFTDVSSSAEGDNPRAIEAGSGTGLHVRDGRFVATGGSPQALRLSSSELRASGLILEVTGGSGGLAHALYGLGANDLRLHDVQVVTNGSAESYGVSLSGGELRATSLDVHVDSDHIARGVHVSGAIAILDRVDVRVTGGTTNCTAMTVRDAGAGADIAGARLLAACPSENTALQVLFGARVRVRDAWVRAEGGDGITTNGSDVQVSAAQVQIAGTDRGIAVSGSDSEFVLNGSSVTGDIAIHVPNFADYSFYVTGSRIVGGSASIPSGSNSLFRIATTQVIPAATSSGTFQCVYVYSGGFSPLDADCR